MVDPDSVFLAQQEAEQSVVPFVVTMLLVGGSALFVYFDARSIGARKGLVDGIANNSPFVWALGTILLWIVVFPLYLFNRDKIRTAAQARQRPTALRYPTWQEQSSWHQPQPHISPVAHQQPPPGTPVAPPPGWYIDPDDSRLYRWWDGTKWTEHRTLPGDEPPSP